MTTIQGWTGEVLNCVEKIKFDIFDLETIYRFEPELKKVYPDNHHIKAKIRQQLQILDDLNLVVRIKDGLFQKRFIIEN